MPEYKLVTLLEMQQVLKSEKGWALNRQLAPRESYFDFGVKNVSKPGHTVVIRVYTSIVDGAPSRQAGTDAIRVQVISLYAGAPTLVRSFKRVHRTAGWATNLRARVTHAFEWARRGMRWCSDCGRIMIVRTSDCNLFYGCSGYPTCKHTETFSKEI